ncbi:MAG: hypothetical protein AAFZ65_01310 [Planctomycetota bacterium]
MRRGSVDGLSAQLQPRPSRWVFGSVVFGVIPTVIDLSLESSWVFPEDELSIPLAPIDYAAFSPR